MDERERLKLIQRLKTVKTSGERDEILWYLAGQDKTARGKPQRAEATGPAHPAPEKPEGRMQVKLPVGKLGGFGSITALLFVFYGLAAIIPAVMKILQDQMDGDEIRQLIVGCVFVFFGIVIFIKAKRAQRKTADEA
ncbi:MAG TPA: hypothetical protein VF827_05845 [Syntrophales bacterium]